MNTLSNIQSIYFVGIGGIGMSALARFAIKKNLAVFGYDKTQTALTATLEKEGADITFEDSVSSLPPNKSMILQSPAFNASSIFAFSCMPKAAS